ncbi:ESX secretion-associated protein EspG [Amycolatopsis sp. YIM 10]|uniref:ESX secretion-associated protein EspG n=1 Tax=Amycolatopsis sp. YIM 10 TaxID=2653857 RepID=UPI0012905321|nr:ESX secretion-associated protein EspG [Amycolatopsis sp. YIM 10]QFU91647.1 hypothetical protein YIM_32430 [Amycolatopsis sp. YIM 10]
MAERFDFTLDPVEVDVLGQALGVPARVFPLRFPLTTGDPARLTALADEVEAGLAGRRLSVRGRLNSWVRRAFELFAGHRALVSITGIDGLGATIAVAGLTDGDQALGITQLPDGDQLVFSLFSDEEFVEVLAGVLPVFAGAPGPVLSVERGADVAMSAMRRRRLAEAEYDDEETDAFGNIELRAKVRPARSDTASTRVPDEDRLAALLAGERLGGGQISVTGGRRAPVLGWVDTAAGRYLVHVDPGANGAMSARYVPAGPAAVADAVGEAVARVY